MKGTHKLKALGNISDVMAASRTVSEAARRLNVSRETVSRWIAAGKVPAPGARRPARQRPREGPTSFAAWARETFDLTPAEDELVQLGQQALDLARDAGQTPGVRLQAMAQFRATLKDLHLPTEATDGDLQATNLRPFPRPA